MRVAVDILGGDHAPGEILLGIASSLTSGVCTSDQLLLVGPEDHIASSLKEQGVESIPEIVHTEVFVESKESPIEALRRKPNASVSLCVKAVREGHAGGLLSFGNTGACVAASTIGLGMLKGVRRPAIAVALKGPRGHFVILDMGANPTPKALHLFHNGLMGAAYARDILDIEQPRVALLNIGGEASKGTPTAKEAYRLMQDSGLSFIGNVEGHELFTGKADVLVTDGLVGNMILKVLEGFSGFLLQEFQRVSSDAPAALRETFQRVLGVSDYSEVGGANLMGVNGVVLIGHGRSKAAAVPPAVSAVLKEIDQNVNLHITDALAHHASAGEPSGASENPS